MKRVLESVINVSEGREPERVEKIVDGVREAKGVKLLDYSSDKDHNRSVITFAGEPERVIEAAFSVVKRAVERIDLTKHKGEHPRIGAADVVPFVPISGIEEKEAVDLSRSLGKRVWEELGVPVYLYERSSTADYRRNLSDIREGEFEGLPTKMKDPRWHPDYGNDAPHPAAGATVVGVRNFLVAYNVNLNTSDVKIAKKIANAIRERRGGLTNVKALGMHLEDRNIGQVSINMVDPMQTPMYRVFEAVRIEAARYGVGIIGSQIVGMVPLEVIVESARYYLQLEDFKTDQILEVRLFE